MAPLTYRELTTLALTIAVKAGNTSFEGSWYVLIAHQQAASRGQDLGSRCDHLILEQLKGYSALGLLELMPLNFEPFREFNAFKIKVTDHGLIYFSEGPTIQALNSKTCKALIQENKWMRSKLAKVARGNDGTNKHLQEILKNLQSLDTSLDSYLYISEVLRHDANEAQERIEEHLQIRYNDLEFV